MKVLYTTARAPFPPHKGDQLIAYEQIKNLQKSCEVYLVTFIKDQQEMEQVKKEMGRYCKKIFFLQSKDIKYSNILKTIYNFKPLQVNYYTNKKLKFEINKIISDVQPDVIHVQTVRIAEYFRDVEVSKVVDMIDALSLNMKRRAKKEKIWAKPLFLFESLLLKRYENIIIDKYNSTILVSEGDKAYFNNKEIFINPNGTYITKELLTKYKDTPKEEALIFHGNMQYFPNVNAVMHFTKEVWPEIHKRYPRIKLYIVGKDPINKVKALNGKSNIVVTGFVEDICEYLCKSSIGIYPLGSGTGMQNKILEALACGLPTVASPMALQGVKGISDNEVLIADTNKKMLENIFMLIEDRKLREQYAIKGQEFIFRNYTWEKNVSRVIDIWKKALSIEYVSNN